MPTVIPKQPKKERDQITIRLNRDVLGTNAVNRRARSTAVQGRLSIAE